MSDRSFEEYNRVIEKRNQIRWISVFVYFSLIIFSIFLQLVIEIDTPVFTSLIVIMIFGGGAILFYVILYPYFSEVEIPLSPDKELMEETSEYNTDSMFSEEVRLKLIYILVIPFLILFTILTIIFLFREDHDQAFMYAFIAFFFTMVLILFDRITIIADSNTILIKLGPFKNEIEMKNVKSIKPVIVKPIREYMGVGKRLGPDGSIGYIAYLKTGVRIIQHEGRDIVVTLKQTQELANLVRYFKLRK